MCDRGRQEIWSEILKWNQRFLSDLKTTSKSAEQTTWDLKTVPHIPNKRIVFHSKDKINPGFQKEEDQLLTTWKTWKPTLIFEWIWCLDVLCSHHHVIMAGGFRKLGGMELLCVGPVLWRRIDITYLLACRNLWVLKSCHKDLNIIQKNSCRRWHSVICV